MSYTEMIKNFTDKVVIIDDGYKQVDPTLYDGDDAAIFNNQVDMQQWQLLRTTYFEDCPLPKNLIENEAALRVAWGIYEADPDSYNIFEPLFSSLVSARKQKLQRLIPFVKYLKETVGLNVIVHPDVDSAKEDIKQCKVVFLDFYLEDGGDVKGMLDNIEPFSNLFSAPPAESEPRFLFLMSSHLPGPADLEEFRKITRLKAAFFKPITKNILAPSWFEKEMSDLITRCPDMIKLTSFLDTFSAMISSVSDRLQSDIDSLELHDLTILNTIRLQVEQEKLGHYLTWLFSEALAAKIRESVPLLMASETVDGIAKQPFVGLLEPKPLLFDLYSEVAFSYPGEINISEPARFGDVYSRVPKQKTGVSSQESSSVDKNTSSMRPEVENGPASDTQASFCGEELLLAISPACDLIRCPAKYEVLCVRGYITKIAPSLSDLFGQEGVFGQNRQLMREKINNKTVYMLVDWKQSEVTTIRATKLNDSGLYKKRARLNELFCHEVKENALRQFGRVGLPVDPSFATALSAAVKIYNDKKMHVFLSPQQTFVSGIRLAGNSHNKPCVIFSLDFRDWLKGVVNEKYRDEKGELPKKVQQLLDHLASPNGLESSLNGKNESLFADKWGKLRYLDKYSEDKFEQHHEIIVYPWSAEGV